MTPNSALELVKACDPDCVIDLGASDGRWSKHVAEHMPKASFVCVDPLEYLDRWVGHNVRWFRNAIASSPGRRDFFVSPDKFGSGFYPGHGNTQVECVTLSDVFPPPQEAKRVFLKYDVHGAEPSTFADFALLLERICAVQIECYNWDIGGLVGWRFYDVAAFMAALDFRVALVFDVLHRGDGILWQMDMLFLRQDHPTFSKEGYFQ